MQYCTNCQQATEEPGLCIKCWDFEAEHDHLPDGSLLAQKREKKRAYQRAYRAKHPQKQASPEYMRVYNKMYYQTHSEQERQRVREYRNTHPRGRTSDG